MTMVDMHAHNFTLMGADGVERTVNGVQLMTARRGLELEVRTGMKLSKGASANVIACEQLGLPKGTKKTKTIEVLKQVLAEAYGTAS